MAHQRTRSPPPPALQYGWKNPMCNSPDCPSALCNCLFLPRRKNLAERTEIRNDNRDRPMTDNKRGFILEEREEVSVLL